MVRSFGDGEKTNDLIVKEGRSRERFSHFAVEHPAKLNRSAMQEHIQHIMLVDDEDDHHFITRLMLKKAGWTGKFTAFLSADDAIEYLCDTHARPDLLLVDINMPATNGFEFLALCERERLLSNEFTTVVMCSSSNRPIDMEQSLRFKVVAEYVEKPLAVDQFQRISHDHLRRKRA